MDINLFQNRKVRNIVLYLFLFLFLAVLATFAYKGFFSRYLQDDYCYGSTIHKYGFFEGVVYPYFNTTEYNGNRYALTLAAGLAEIVLGTKLQSLFSLLTILVWLSSLTFLIIGISKKLRKEYSFLLSLLLAAILISFAFFMAPDLYQTLYWRNSSLTYLAPLILDTFLLGWGLNLGESTKLSWFMYPVIFLVSFVTAGFSEAATVWQITVWGLILIFNNVLKKYNPDIKKYNVVILVTLAGALLGALLLIISPTNAVSLTGSSVKMAGFSTLIKKSFRFGFDFLNYSLSGKWLPFLILFLFGFTFAQFAQEKKLSFKSWAIRVIITILCTYIISVACMMPSVLVRTAYPDGRALLLPHSILVIGLFLLGYFTGEAIQITQIFGSRKVFSNLAIAMLLLGLAAYSARIIPVTTTDISPLRARAAAWDQRQALIYQDRSAGLTHIIVPAFDSIDHINELHLEEDHWVNQCAARYYGVSGISAQENYNGVKPYFEN